MADYTGNVVSCTLTNGVGDSVLGDVLRLRRRVSQRIWDTTAGWCSYTKDNIDIAPLAGETVPNHTNNLVSGTHQIIGEIQ